MMGFGWHDEDENGLIPTISPCAHSVEISVYNLGAIWGQIGASEPFFCHQAGY